MTGSPAITSRLGGSTTTLAGAIPAQDRTIPVDEPWTSMLPAGGLQRGRVVGCDGPAAVTVAASLVAGATRAGSWVLLLGASMIGLEALAEVGVRLDRVVAVEVDAGPASWAERAVAAADGFELIVTVPPSGAERVERQVRQRLHARGAVLVPVGVAGHTIGCDVAVTTAAPRWFGIGPGHGRLVARQADVVVGGRRVPRPVRRTLWLPGPDGRVRLADTAHDAVSELLVG
ncbi:MAG: hypothetical protein ACLGHQ_02280 [Acidimicrobiia bacterium]